MGFKSHSVSSITSQAVFIFHTVWFLQGPRFARSKECVRKREAQGESWEGRTMKTCHGQKRLACYLIAEPTSGRQNRGRRQGHEILQQAHTSAGKSAARVPRLVQTKSLIDMCICVGMCSTRVGMEPRAFTQCYRARPFFALWVRVLLSSNAAQGGLELAILLHRLPSVLEWQEWATILHWPGLNVQLLGLIPERYPSKENLSVAYCVHGPCVVSWKTRSLREGTAFHKDRTKVQSAFPGECRQGSTGQQRYRRGVRLCLDQGPSS